MRLYPQGHPALKPAETRLRQDLQELGEVPWARLVLNPDRVFWGEHEVTLPSESPGRKLVQMLFQLGLAVLEMTFPQAEEGVVALAGKLASLGETPREEDRQSLLEAAASLPGVELFPLELSSVQIIDEDAVQQKDGHRMVWPQLAKMLADGAFAGPGKLKEGLLDATSVVAVANQLPDPGPLFEYLFQTVKELLVQSPQTQRRLFLSELRLFLADLFRLLQPEGRARAVAAFLHQPSLAALQTEREPLIPWEVLLDGVELLLLVGEPVPEAIQRMLFQLASPEANQSMKAPSELILRARQLLARLPLESEFATQLPTPPARLPQGWPGQPWARELSASLTPEEIRAHLVRALGEMLTLWPGHEAGEAAASYMEKLFVEAVREADYPTAQRLAPLVGSSRNVHLQEKSLQEAVAATVAAMAAADRQAHPLLIAILSGLGERALPAILEALDQEERLVVRKRLLEVVLRYGSHAIPYLRSRLEDDRWYVVRNAIFLLRRLGDRTSVPALRGLLPNCRPQVAAEILKTLVAFEEPDWLPVLRKELESEDDERVKAALNVASKIRHPGVVRVLVNRLRQQFGMKLREPLTLDLIRSLGRLRDGRALPVLQELLELKQWRYPFSLELIRKEAASAIAQLDSPEAQRLAGALAAGKDKALAEAVRRGLASTTKAEEEEE
ncbi:MAG: HEAT repeat domain-containing protein [Thermoanaerobaculaceae bacterium]